MAKSAPPFHVYMPRGGTSAGRSLWNQARTGMGTVLANFQKWADWMNLEVVPEAMAEALEGTMDLSDHYAPKDTHTMVNSRYIKVKKSRGGNARAEVGYNRYGEAPYTIFVHEMPQFYHEPPTTYKFLERAIDEDTPELLGRLASNLKARAGT